MNGTREAVAWLERDLDVLTQPLAAQEVFAAGGESTGLLMYKTKGGEELNKYSDAPGVQVTQPIFMIKKDWR